MNPVPASVGAPRTPLVDLFPAAVVQKRSDQRTLRLLGAILGIFAFALLAVAALAYMNRQSAEADLAATTALTPGRQTELAKYNYLPALEAQVANSKNARTWAGIADIAWTDQLSALLGTLPASARLDALSAAPATPIAPLATGKSLFSTPDLGVVTFSGDLEYPIDAAALEDAINALPGFKDATIDTVAIQDGKTIAYWTFSGSVRITPNAASGRTTTTQKVVPVEPTAAATTKGKG